MNTSISLEYQLAPNCDNLRLICRSILGRVITIFHVTIISIRCRKIKGLLIIPMLLSVFILKARFGESITSLLNIALLTYYDGDVSLIDCILSYVARRSRRGDK
jgi:hypothetical protein